MLCGCVFSVICTEQGVLSGYVLNASRRVLCEAVFLCGCTAQDLQRGGVPRGDVLDGEWGVLCGDALNGVRGVAWGLQGPGRPQQCGFLGVLFAVWLSEGRGPSSFGASHMP